MQNYWSRAGLSLGTMGLIFGLREMLPRRPEKDTTNRLWVSVAMMSLLFLVPTRQMILHPLWLLAVLALLVLYAYYSTAMEFGDLHDMSTRASLGVAVLLVMFAIRMGPSFSGLALSRVILVLALLAVSLSSFLGVKSAQRGEKELSPESRNLVDAMLIPVLFLLVISENAADLPQQNGLALIPSMAVSGMVGVSIFQFAQNLITGA